jgi:hypothetical protein
MQIQITSLYNRSIKMLLTNNGTNASTNTKRSRNPTTKENLYHDCHAGFNRSISRGR